MNRLIGSLVLLGTTAFLVSVAAPLQARTHATSPPLGALPRGAGFPQAFAFDPRNPDIVYVATVSYPHDTTRAHVYKTTDGGREWHPTATKGAGWTGDTVTLTADPRHSGTLYAGTNVAVYKTVDGGRSWRPWNRGLFSPPGPNRPFGTPGTPGTPSFNRGNGWVTDIAVDPANTNIVYSTADAVRKSTDGGHSWKSVFRPYRGAGRVSRLAIAPTRPEAIYAIAGDWNGRSSIYKSTDAGKTWHATGGPGSVFTNPDGYGSALAVDPQQPTTLYSAIDRAVFTSTDAGVSWQPITDGLPQGVATALAVDPQHSGTVYAALQTGNRTGGIYATTDGGHTWSSAFSGVAIYALAVDPARPATIYAAGPRLLRSTDDGHTWAIAP